MDTNKIGVYILECCNNRYYIGSTINFDIRIQEHQNGRVTATKYVLPVILRRFIPCNNLTEARQSEYRLKKYKNKKITEKIIKSGNFPWDYNKNKGGLALRLQSESNCSRTVGRAVRFESDRSEVQILYRPPCAAGEDEQGTIGR